MEPKTTLWRLEPHSVGKHLVLKNYLNAWFPIMGSTNRRILFVDGFAGPGEYSGGEKGSPQIALNSLHEHRSKSIIRAEVVFIFIGKQHDRAEHLKDLIEKIKLCLPNNCKTEVVEGTFDGTMTEVLNSLDEQEKYLAPSFVMIDPFGVSGTPMSVIERIFKNPKSEIYISFMYDSINRFKDTPEFSQPLDQLFGCKEWRNGININNQTDRKNFYYNLYKKQLRKHGAKYIVHFELFKNNRLVYAIFFGTKHITGCDRMKQAIWKVAPFGNFAFKGTHDHQLTLGLNCPDFEPLKNTIKSIFKNKGWVSVEEIIHFVSSDQTDYHSGQVKKGVLIPMETNGEIGIREDTRKRKRTFPNHTLLRIL